MEIKYYEQYNVGKAKYVVSYSNGTKKHNDGSEFWDIAIFKSKKAKNEFIKNLTNNE